MARKIEGFIMIGVFMIVAGCFSIPIIIYAANSQDTAATNRNVVIEQLDINACSQQVSSELFYNGMARGAGCPGFIKI